MHNESKGRFVKPLYESPKVMNLDKDEHASGLCNMQGSGDSSHCIDGISAAGSGEGYGCDPGSSAPEYCYSGFSAFECYSAGLSGS